MEMNNFMWLSEQNGYTTRLDEDIYEAYQLFYKEQGYKEFLYMINDEIEQMGKEGWKPQYKAQTRRVTIWANEKTKKILDDYKAKGYSNSSVIREAIERVLDDFGML